MRTVWTWFGLVVLAPLAVLLLASPALAGGNSHDRIGLSRDGVHWTSDLGAPLFDKTIRWVPGDRRTTRFYVRNQSTDGSDMTLAVQRTATDGLAGTGWLRISARAGSGPWHTVSGAADRRLVRLAGLDSGSVVPVQLRVSMAWRAPNRTMVLASRLGLHVRLDQTLADGHAGALPNTGSPFPSWLPVLALLLLASGVLLTSRTTARRPRRRTPRLSERPT